MNPFEELCNDQVSLRDQSGTETGPYKCTLTKGEITIFEEALPVTEGDHALRDLPNRRQEVYRILETNYSPGLMGDIPPHWRLKVEKESSIPGRSSKSTVVNISDSQGIQVGDHNLQNIEVTLRALVTAIEEAGGSEEEKAEAKGRLRAFLEHPLLTGILGGAAGSALGLLK